VLGVRDFRYRAVKFKISPTEKGREIVEISRPFYLLAHKFLTNDLLDEEGGQIDEEREENRQNNHQSCHAVG
jgi:hypothetical protein